MADNTIDKALPNEPRKEITLPGEEEIQETLVEEVEAELEKPGEVDSSEMKMVQLILTLIQKLPLKKVVMTTMQT